MDEVEELRRRGQLQEALALVKRSRAAPTAERLASKAMVLLDLGRGRSANTAAQAALELDNESHRAIVAAGLSGLEVGDVGSAWELAQRARDASADSGLADVLLASLYGEQEQHDLALDLLEQAVRSRPFDNDVRLAKAITLSDLDRSTDALREIDLVLARSVRHAEAHALRSLVLCNLGESEAAITEGTLAIELAPDLATAHLALGLALLSAGDLDAAIPPLDRAVVTSERANTSLFCRSLIEVVRGDHERVLAVLSRARRESPSSVRADIACARARALFELDRTSEASAEIAAAILLRPDHADTLRLRAELRYAGGEIESARADALRVLARSPSDPRAGVINAATLLDLGRTEDALTAVGLVLEQDRDIAGAVFLHGIACVRLHRPADARIDHDRLLELDDPTSAEALAELLSASSSTSSTPPVAKVDWWQGLHRLMTIKEIVSHLLP